MNDKEIIPWNKFGEIESYDNLEKYLNGKEYRHTEFCHYTSLGVVNMILQNNSFRLSCVKNFNDTKEARDIENASHKFSLCFSTGVNENLPLWYMYSGIDGHGARIRIKRGAIERFIRDSKFYLSEIDNGGQYVGEKIELQDGQNMKLKFRDVLYINEDKCAVKYNTMTNYKLSLDSIQRYKKNNNGFCKEIVWYYEKETRLMIEIIDSDIMDESRDYAIIMEFPKKLRENIWIDLAPEKDAQNHEDIKGFPEICKFVMESSNLNNSLYCNQVQMDMCKKNMDVFGAYIIKKLEESKVGKERIDEIKKEIKDIKDIKGLI